MTEEWPSYHKGRCDHIHALGVIALACRSFERGLITVYAHHRVQQHMPCELVQLYYSSLNEKSELKAIRSQRRRSAASGVVFFGLVSV